MHDLGKGIEVSGTVTIGQIIATGAVEEATAAVAALSASYYLGALLGAAIYASAKQGWDFLTGGPGLFELYERYRNQIPNFTLPASPEEVLLPDKQVAHEDPPPPPPYPDHIIELWSADVESTRFIQARLQQHGCIHQDPDGKFGPITDAGVRLFQATHELEVDGRVGTDTWEALFARRSGNPA